MRYVILMLLAGCVVDVGDVKCATDCDELCDWNEACVQRRCRPKKRELGCEHATPPDQQATD